MARRFAEAKEERKTPRTGIRIEAQPLGAEMRALRLERRAQFRWVIGLELLALVEMVILIIRVFFWEMF